MELVSEQLGPRREVRTLETGFLEVVAAKVVGRERRSKKAPLPSFICVTVAISAVRQERVFDAGLLFRESERQPVAARRS